MSNIKNVGNTAIPGELSVNGNTNIGGHITTQLGAHIKGSVKVDGWLEAPNVKDANKGLFESLDALQEAYPKPEKGWWALVPIVIQEISDDVAVTSAIVEGVVSVPSLDAGSMTANVQCEVYVGNGQQWVKLNAGQLIINIPVGYIEAQVNAVADRVSDNEAAIGDVPLLNGATIVAAIKAEIARAEAAELELNSEIIHVDGRIDDVWELTRPRLEANESGLDTLQSDIRGINTQLDSLDTKVANLDRKVTAFDGRITEAKEQADGAAQQVALVEQHIGDTSQLNGVDIVTAIKAEIARAEAAELELNSEITHVDGRIDDVWELTRPRLEANESGLDTLQSDIRDINTQLDSLDTKAFVTQNELTDYKVANNANVEVIRDNITSIRDSIGNLAAIRPTPQVQTTITEAISNEVERAQLVEGELQTEIDELTDSLNAEVQRAQEVERNLGTQFNRLEGNVEARLSGWDEKIDSATAQVEENTRVVNRLDENVGDWKTSLERSIADAKSTLNDKIDAEIDRAQHAEGNLGFLETEWKGDLVYAINEVVGNVNAEKQRAMTAENSIKHTLETNIATKVDELQRNIQAITIRLNGWGLGVKDNQLCVEV